MRNKYIKTICAVLGAFVFVSAPAYAWHVKGKVLCDVNQSGSIDSGDQPLSAFGFPDVLVNAVDSKGGYYSAITDATGYYFIGLPDFPETYTETLDLSTLPNDVSIIQPPGGQYNFELTDTTVYVKRDWLVDSSVCHPVAEKCWLTAGGVKFSSISRTSMAEHGPRHNLGGNVFPGCDPDPGNGGQWNHLAHPEKLHFLGTDIHTVSCGNVAGIEPGSESPVTPYNFIEFKGTGRLTGIRGNKVDHGMVYFFARAEDRNEPGSHGAKAGEDIDRYFIHVFSDPANPVGTTLLLVDANGDASTVDPVTISGGNLQLHISSCDKPPVQ